MSADTAERVALVVGAASGLGAGVAARLAADGLVVETADRNAGGAVRAVEVTDEASVAALLAAVHDEHGRLDVVVTCAGISTFSVIEDHDAAEFRGVLDVCLTGTFLVLKHAAPRLTHGGSVVTVSSLNARQPAVGMAAYCSAKAGVSMLTEVAALELAPRGVRVNAVAPGFVPTPLTAPALEVPGVGEDYVDNTPLGRLGTVEDVAAAVSFLADPAQSGWMTGEVLDLNGGAHLKRYPNLDAHISAMLG